VYLEQKLDENSGRAGRIVLVQLDDGQYGPVDGVSEQQVREDLGDVSKFADFEPGIVNDRL